MSMLRHRIIQPPLHSRCASAKVQHVGFKPTYRKRCKRWDFPWNAHFLTFSCFGQQAFLSKDRSRLWFLDSLQRARGRYPFDLWGYVIMPEHVHLLIWPHEGVEISKILKSLKEPVTKHAVRWLKEGNPAALARLLDVQPNGQRHYRFWQRGGGYDRNMRDVAETHEKLCYLHHNPVRRGLAAKPEDWPWSSAKAWLTGVDEPLKIDRESFPVLQVTEPWRYLRG